MAALQLTPDELEQLAQQIVREMARVRETPPFISEAELAERWKLNARVLQEARNGGGRVLVKGRLVELPDTFTVGRRFCYVLARRSGARSVLDVEDEAFGG